MAASIYATPPPDLSSEDTALSDVSNTSSTNNATVQQQQQHQQQQAAVAATLKHLTSTTATTTMTNYEDTSSKHLNTTTSSSSTAATTKTSTTASTTLSNNNSNKKQKRTIADVLKDKPTTQNNSNTINNTTTQCSSSLPNMGSSINALDTEDNNADDDDVDNSKTTQAMAAVAAAANAAMQLQLLEAINDANKKRRKQHNPSRMDDETTTTTATTLSAHNKDSTVSIDYEDKLSKMFLPKSMEQLKETFELLQQQQQQHHQQQQQIENISKTQELNDTKPINNISDIDDPNHPHHHSQAFNNPYHTYCKQCGENFENEFKLSLHMLHEHNETGEAYTNLHNSGSAGDLTPLDILASVKVKLERPECESPSSNHNSEPGQTSEQHNLSATSSMLTNGKEHHHQQQQQQQHQWLSGQANMTPMGFPFPSEAAAALQAGGYLPLLGVPGFPGVDGLNRPPLRIFNPEAFCELCNKEFCNKYFLKTHKANKHGIYDPSSDGLSVSQQQNQNSMNAMNQMFQLQMQQQHQHLQQQQQMQMELAQQQQKVLSDNQQRKDNETSNTSVATQNSGNNQITPPAPPPVFCDVCSKRFTNIFAMRRHRAKAHEQNTTSSNNNSQRNSPTEVNSNNNQNNSNNLEPPISPSSLTDLQPPNKQFQMPDGFRQDFVLEQEEVSFTPQPRKLSPQSQQQAREANFAHDKLKRLGVLNPEAFCEICCKEYCNKYFLRTHKWKRHGIFMPPDDAENSQKLPTWPFMNMPGMPVNLMMAQRMMSTSQDNANDDLSSSQQSSKRIKLELPEEEETTVKDLTNDENQENRSENNQVLSVPSTPEPHKLQNSETTTNLNQNSETAMGLQNLQKLQTMIQQLNDLNGKRPIACHLCGRECENQYALQAHIMAEHNVGMDGMAPMNFPSQLLMQQQQAMLKQSPSGSPGSLIPLMGMSTGTGELRCTPCDREFNNLPEFQKHITEVHLLPNTTGSPLQEGFLTPERPVNPNMAQGTRPPYTITPTSSYCEICNKELCNKYFMKTHMQRMHGIEIENGAQIGGVVCNICNKELCSKYFLRVHKHNTHGIIEDGAPLPQPRQNGLNLETALQQQMLDADALNRNLNMSPFGSGGSEGKPESYNSYTEICPICSRRFRNIKWLRSHLVTDHGPAGMEKVRELEQQYGGSLSKPSSPTLKIPNGSNSVGSSQTAAATTTPNTVPSPAQLAQALQNLNAQHLLQNIPKNNMSASFGNDSNLPQSPQLKEYQCSMCPFTTPYYAFLFIHERTHSIINNNEEHHKETKEKQDEEEHDKQKDECEILRNNKVKIHNENLNMPQDDNENDDDEEELHSELISNEPTNLSMRTPSPTEISSTTTREDLQKHNSPKTLTHANSLNDLKDFQRSADLTKATRSVACSPVYSLQQQLLQEMPDHTGKSASFAVPRDFATSSSDPTPQMQAFIMEPQQEDSDDMENKSNRFVPAIVYLPVTERMTGSMKISFNLTPV